MAEHNIIIEKAMLQYAATVVKQVQLDEWATDESLEEDFTPSPKYLKMRKRLLAKAKREDQWQQSSGALRRVAAFILVPLAMIALVFAPVEAVQQAVVTTVIEWYDKFASLHFSTNTQSSNILPESISFNYVPNGYEQIAQDIDLGLFYTASFKNNENLQIYIYIEVLNQSINFFQDNEYTKYIQLKAQDKSYFWLAEEDGKNALIWEENSLVFRIISYEPINEMIKMAEGIEY